MNVNVDGMHYYDLQRNWTRKIAPHLDNQTLNAILVRDFNNYYLETLSESFRLRYWAYVAFGACHWIVNFSLCLALLAEPKQTWRIVTSDEYSTVWDGRKTLFDFNDQAFGISASECWRRARYGKNHEVVTGAVKAFPCQTTTAAAYSKEIKHNDFVIELYLARQSQEIDGYGVITIARWEKWRDLQAAPRKLVQTKG